MITGNGEDDGENQRRLKRMDEIGPGANKPVTARAVEAVVAPAAEPAAEPAPEATSSAVPAVTVTAVVMPATAPVPAPPTRPHKEQLRREPLFEWPQQRTYQNRTSRDKELNPNQIFYSKHRPGTARAASPRGQPAAAVAPSTQRNQQKQDGTVVSVLGVYSAAPRRRRQQTPDSDSALHLWSTKHHPSSARQARRTAGSGGVSGRPPSAHINVAKGTHHNPRMSMLSVRPNACSAHVNVPASYSSSTARPSTAPQQRVTIAVPPPSEKDAVAGALVVEPKRPTSTDIVFNSSNRLPLRPQTASPCMQGGRKRIPAQPVVTSARQQRSMTAAAASSGRASSRDHREEELDLGLAWLAAAGTEGEDLTRFFEVTGMGGRCRPAAAARQHVIAVDSRGAYRSGRPEANGHRPNSGRPKPPPGWDKPAFMERPRLTRQQVADLITNGGLMTNGTLTEL